MNEPEHWLPADLEPLHPRRPDLELLCFVASFGLLLGVGLGWVFVYWWNGGLFT